jgi:hypothetical protein
MGNTFRLLAGGVDAVESAFGHGGTPSFVARVLDGEATAKGEKPFWGARKIRERLVKHLPGDVRIPAKSTIHAVLDRHGLVNRAKRTRNRATGTGGIGSSAHHPGAASRSLASPEKLLNWRIAT